MRLQTMFKKNRRPDQPVKLKVYKCDCCGEIIEAQKKDFEDNFGEVYSAFVIPFDWKIIGDFLICNNCYKKMFTEEDLE